MKNKTMTDKGKTPGYAAYRMPGEFESHEGCVMIWPVRPGSWTNGGREAQKVFAKIARIISESETVWMLARPEDAADVCRTLGAELWNGGHISGAKMPGGCQTHDTEQCSGRCTSDLQQRDDRLKHVDHPPAGDERFPVYVLPVATNDAWARDVGPTCVISASGEVCGVDWQFNAWGGSYNGLYADWEEDNAAAEKICRALQIPRIDAGSFVMEGGAVHSDGEGTLLVTEACLLSKGRNPQLDKSGIERELKRYLGAEKIIWLPHGIYNDETDEHVDNMCAFVRPGTVVLAWTEDEADPQYAYSREALRILESERDARGRRIDVHLLPIPADPVCATEKEIAALEPEEGEDERTPGERLAASYVNFYISNGGVLVPQFGDANDGQALRILGELFPERTIYPVPARDIIIGGGNIHCITQNVPRKQ